jgi:preprotein translocase subunit YajC
MNPFTLITPAYAQDAVGGLLGPATQFAPLILIFVVFYFLLIRPQQQKQKEMRTMLSSLKRGDRVVTGAAYSAPYSAFPWYRTRTASRSRPPKSRLRLPPTCA